MNTDTILIERTIKLPTLDDVQRRIAGELGSDGEPAHPALVRKIAVITLQEMERLLNTQDVEVVS